MQKKQAIIATQLDFKQQTPNVLIGTAKFDSLQADTFLSGEENCKTEFAQNTATWD